jgi:hypothetical protein
MPIPATEGMPEDRRSVGRRSDAGGRSPYIYIMVTEVVWCFLWFVWRKKTLKAVRKLKEGEVLNFT